MSQFHTLNIKDITRQTDQCVSITFAVPDHLKEDYKFKAGQYITLKTDIEGKEVRRDYSLCTSPSSGNLTVAVKEVENGTFSKYANQVLKVGDTLDVAQPQGRFTFTPDTSKTRTIAAFAAGSGITPVLSIVKTVLEEEPNSKFVLVYGNKTLKDTIFLNDLLDIQNKYSDRLTIQFLYSQSQEKDALFGRIEKSTVNFIVKNKYKDVNIDAFYLCGPEGMINTVKDVLAENNIEDSKVFFELFTTTSSVSVEDLEEVTDGTTSITVIVDDEEKTFTMSQQQSVLEAALEQDLDAPYSCQGGICSSCLARVKEGKATMRQNNILTDNEVAEGLVLTCQAHPVSSKIIVDYDDI
ncbi:ring-1,2-phenylacetyl-CoA epoxidase subunit PaaE [Mesoflavibacter sabulilitoris]|uniref:Flavodoxin reductase n=1 Tax=Mesoflavibacter zeaxanthinifaciens subsp. sabulilitoris TaxID=1520893 RepID=A0A2T1N6F1_9FLAO|nr:ferredoxin--NADP reductase [Mesoflavibacter zeaxanthinifaciens]MBB3123200.1 ring-1,2-phenylacetyl-CoA epoxidase subunit PaaE [Mesoflavibacter zeaxanthinifaciens subsp. sabulilitoris]PSG87162.1 flavodoxin reductase [Mesoflavibacter zeaxanthinifaciens subsp. sabulilitoris]